MIKVLSIRASALALQVADYAVTIVIADGHADGTCKQLARWESQMWQLPRPALRNPKEYVLLGSVFVQSTPQHSHHKSQNMPGPSWLPTVTPLEFARRWQVGDHTGLDGRWRMLGVASSVANVSKGPAAQAKKQAGGSPPR